jgi:diguanylate cyclase (GGDEF)-like protein
MELRMYLRMLRAGWWIILLAALAGLNIALVTSYLATPMYQSIARLLVTPNVALIKSSVDRVDSLVALDRPSIVATYAQVLQSARMFRETAVGLQREPEILAKDYAVTAVVLPDASVIQLAVTGPDPYLATTLANNISQRAIDYVNGLYQVYNMGFIDMAEVPKGPYSPQPLRNAGVAVVLGLVIGAVLAVVREQLHVPRAVMFQRRQLDPVSRAYGRRYFERMIDKATQKPGEEVALGLVYFDGLDDLLETLPRSVTQGLLRHIVRTLGGQLRGNDLVARWTDDQFAVLLPATGGPGASRVLERIRGNLVEPVPLGNGEPIILEPRIGVGVRQNNELADVLINRARQAMAYARRQGLTKVVVKPEITQA